MVVGLLNIQRAFKTMLPLNISYHLDHSTVCCIADMFFPLSMANRIHRYTGCFSKERDKSVITELHMLH